MQDLKRILIYQAQSIFQNANIIFYLELRDIKYALIYTIITITFILISINIIYLVVVLKLVTKYKHLRFRYILSEQLNLFSKKHSKYKKDILYFCLDRDRRKNC